MIVIYFLLTLFFIILGLKISKTIFNPLSIFNGVWFLIVFLYQFHLSRLQRPLVPETILLLISCVLSFSLVYLGVYFYKKKTDKTKEITNLKPLIGFDLTKKIFFAWLLIEIIETVVSGGIPIVWKIIGSEKTYFDYGIPTLHGFANSIVLVLMMLFFYNFLFDKKNRKKIFFYLFFLFAFYLCLITRQVIISGIIQCIIIYFLYYKKVSWPKFLGLCFLVIFAFGIVGNFRTGYENFMDVALLESDLPSWLSGFYWVYMYLTMTVANINNTVILGITGYGMEPIIRSFLPTIFNRLLFGTSSLQIPQYIVTKAFNVSGFFINFYLGYALIGVIIISIIFGILGIIGYQLIKKIRNQRNIMIYAVIIQIIALSFFANHLLDLANSFQFVIILVLFYVVQKKKNQRILVSILMATHNTEKRQLVEAMESILNQTHKNFEFIIVVDGGEDDNFITENFHDDRIRIIKNESNFGLAKSLNIGLKQCKGKYVFRMDSDDVSLPTRLGVQICYLEENPDVILCASYAKKIGDKIGIITVEFNSQEDIKCQMLVTNPLIHPSVCIRNTCLKENNLKYNEKYIYSQDFEFWQQLKNYGEMYVIPKVLLKYRIHHKQISVSKRDVQNKLCKELLSQVLKKETDLYSKQNMDCLYVLNTYVAMPLNEKNVFKVDEFIEKLCSDSLLRQKGYDLKELENILNYKFLILNIKYKMLSYSLKDRKLRKRLINLSNIMYLLKKIISVIKGYIYCFWTQLLFQLIRRNYAKK